MSFAGDDRFSATNSLRREYDSLLEHKQYLLKENQDLREFDRQMNQKLTSHHEVLRMLTTNIQSVKLEIQKLEGIKAQLLNEQSSKLVQDAESGTNGNTNNLDNRQESTNNNNKVTLQEILLTSYTEEILSSMDHKDILHIIQTLQQATNQTK